MLKEIVKLFLLSISLSSCAASMAVTSRPAPELSEIGIGSTRSEVEDLMGLPEKTMLLPYGQQIYYYKFKSGTYPSASRTIFHGAMSVGSSGLWDFLGIPLEEFNRREKLLAVTYNRKNIVIDTEVHERIN